MSLSSPACLKHVRVSGVLALAFSVALGTTVEAQSIFTYLGADLFARPATLVPITPYGVAVDGDGTIYISHFSKRIVGINRSSGQIWRDRGPKRNVDSSSPFLSFSPRAADTAPHEARANPGIESSRTGQM